MFETFRNYFYLKNKNSNIIYGSTYFDHYAYGQLDDLSSLKLRTDSLREFSLFSFKSNLKKVRGRLEYYKFNTHYFMN